MLNLPHRHVSDVARRNLERFRATSLAQELDDDARRWEVMEWSWSDEPPLRVQLRSERGEVVEFVMDGDGLWRAHADPNVPREPVPR